MRMVDNSEWAAQCVAGFPERWRGRLLRSWAGKAKPGVIEYRHGAAKQFGESFAGDLYEANRELREIVDRLCMVRLSLDAGDAEICQRADEFARYCMDLGAIQSTVEGVRAGMESFVRSVGAEPPSDKVKDRPAIARMAFPQWWRRQLRKLHAKAVEGAAIQLGYVNRARDLYVSNESLARRQQQNRRNAAMMESTVMRNELEQEYTLAELAALGTANKAIRRGELMTRIAGFERIALDMKHAGVFVTVTCPSRMHRWIKAGGEKVYENRKYDGTSPALAQKYLSRCWSRARSALGRRDVGVYGFRIAEPHHEACPHWHMLFFCEQGRVDALVDVMRRYFLADSPDEAGAQQHRVTVERIDWSRGSAAGYIAKYVAKNIDGLHVENDLYGNPAMETSQRVEAWAATWGIRQFQQIGGAPVGVWRELRRVKEVPEGAPEHLRLAHAAVNKIEGRQAADFGAYVMAQGGPTVGRDARIKLAKEQDGELGRYGELIAARPVGVETVGGETYRDGIVPDRFRLVHWLVKSVRHVWEVVRRAARSVAPRTCVNNCTRKGVEVERFGWPGHGSGGGIGVQPDRRSSCRDGEGGGGGSFYENHGMPAAAF